MIQSRMTYRTITANGSANHLTVQGLQKISKPPNMAKFAVDSMFKTAACTKMRHGQ